MKTGGELRVLPGTYRESIEVESAGTAGGLSVIGTGGRPVLDGGRKLTLGFWFTDSKNITVENFEIRGFTDVGVGAESSEEIVFQDLRVHDNGFDAQLTDWEIEGYGIQLDVVDGYLVENNEVFRNGPKPKNFPDKIMGTGIDTFGSSNGIIRGNKSYENIGGGILVEESTDIIVEKNEVYANDLDATRDEWWDGGLWLDGGRDVIVRDNIFRDNLGPGILISDEDRQDPRGYVIERNISSNNIFGIYIWNFGTDDWPAADVIKKSGNTFDDNQAGDVIIHAWDYDPKTMNP